MTATVTQLHPDRDRAEWDRLVAAFIRRGKVSRLAPNTLAAYASNLETYRAWAEAQGRTQDPALVSEEDVESFQVALVEGTAGRGRGGTAPVRPAAPATQARMYASLKQFFRFLVKQGARPVSPLANLDRPKVPAPRTPVVGQDTIDALFRATDAAGLPAGSRRYLARRDRVVLLLLLDCGLRRQEVAHLLVEEVHLDHPLGAHIEVNGTKGEKSRLVPVGDATADALDTFLTFDRPGHRLADRVVRVGRSDTAREGHPLLLADGRGARPGSVGIAVDSVAFIVRRMCARAGVAEVPHPHQFRHTWAAQLQESEVPLDQLMYLGGWSDPAMVRRYGAATLEARTLRARRSPVDMAFGRVLGHGSGRVR